MSQAAWLRPEHMASQHNVGIFKVACSDSEHDGSWLWNVHFNLVEWKISTWLHIKRAGKVKNAENSSMKFYAAFFIVPIFGDPIYQEDQTAQESISVADVEAVKGEIQASNVKILFSCLIISKIIIRYGGSRRRSRSDSTRTSRLADWRPGLKGSVKQILNRFIKKGI